ncbi:MAG: sulfurtransferase [Nitrospirota bacterium]|nr:sulfurtransferase [Nitrospirota bacterium]
MFSRKKVLICIVSLLFILSLAGGYQSAYAGSQPLVETGWLSKNLDNVKVVFVDNWPSDKEEYAKKHIKGSSMMGVGALMGTFNGGNPDKAKFEGMMQSLGISSNDHVVLYGAKGENVFTLGAFWLMEYFGHKNVSYLNGGLAKWNKENLASEGGTPAAAPGSYKAASANESIRTTADAVLAGLNNKGSVLVDARGTGEYNGEVNNDKNKRVGHIPGALDLDSKSNFNADGTIKSAAELKTLYESKGVTKDKNVTTYCQGAIKAANAYFALKHVLGYPNVKVYAGSWGEWSRSDYNKYPIVGKIAEEKK